VPKGPRELRVFAALEAIERVLYIAVAVLLMVVAGGIVAYGAFMLASDWKDAFFTASINTINDMLLALIVLELLRTVLTFARGHVIKPNLVGSLVPFLVIAAISASRRLLAIGAMLSVEEAKGALEDRRFSQAMTELGVSGGLVVAIGLTLVVVRVYSRVERETPRGTGEGKL
jgi:uncharacterized membrane protein (DUF373 family)